MIVSSSGGIGLENPPIRVPVPASIEIAVHDPAGQLIPSQVLPAWPAHPHVQEGTPVAPNPTVVFHLPKPLSSLGYFSQPKRVSPPLLDVYALSSHNRPTHTPCVGVTARMMLFSTKGRCCRGSYLQGQRAVFLFDIRFMVASCGSLGEWLDFISTNC